MPKEDSTSRIFPVQDVRRHLEHERHELPSRNEIRDSTVKRAKEYARMGGTNISLATPPQAEDNLLQDQRRSQAEVRRFQKDVVVVERYTGGYRFRPCPRHK